ncbi:unnamed protein product [Didymodactylos carnosus]|uniref:Uncharacterized protein n=1 Tax=Didymodactylos carnosus TaxID=1234261 RepID=A0A8S2J9G4_9BILA|nr:unnamed protein product [Didymodactylos carnosus]CAF3798203.1 unnamed protein product [Didymodactylos carnosus]
MICIIGFAFTKNAKIHKFDAKHHNHAPEASKPEALKACIQMKELAQISNDQPAQIISNVIATTSREIQPCLPRKDALGQKIKTAKRVCDEGVEPKTLDDFTLPDAYSWHRLREIGRAHVGIFTMIKQIQKEQNEVEVEIEKSIPGEQVQRSARKTKTENPEFKMLLLIALIDQLSIFFGALTSNMCRPNELSVKYTCRSNNLSAKWCRPSDCWPSERDPH